MPRDDPEHRLQVQLTKWVRACVPMPHFFAGLDIAKKASAITRMQDKARGVISGVPDTIMLVAGLPVIAVELKAPGNRPTPRQFEVGEAIRAAGHVWGWCDTVTGYFELLRSLRVPLDARAGFWAAHYDAFLTGAAIRREEGKTGKVSVRRFAAKPSAARVAKAEALRSRVRF